MALLLTVANLLQVNIRKGLVHPWQRDDIDLGEHPWRQRGSMALERHVLHVVTTFYVF